MPVTGSWIAYSERQMEKARKADEEIISRALRFDPKPHYERGDTTAASARLVELREKERLALKVARELITPIEEQAAQYKPRFMAVVEGIEARPCRPAQSGRRPAARMHDIALIEPTGASIRAMAMAPAALAIVAVCGCRWPIGEPSASGFSFCNKKRARLNFYCEAHARESRK